MVLKSPFGNDIPREKKNRRNWHPEEATNPNKKKSEWFREREKKKVSACFSFFLPLAQFILFISYSSFSRWKSYVRLETSHGIGRRQRRTDSIWYSIQSPLRLVSDIVHFTIRGRFQFHSSQLYFYASEAVVTKSRWLRINLRHIIFLFYSMHSWGKHKEKTLFVPDADTFFHEGENFSPSFETFR